MTRTKKIKVLVVEDDREAAFTIARLLTKRFSAEVDTALTIQSARQFLAGSSYDIITLDYQLPDGDGISLLEEIGSSNGHTRAIVVTGHGDEQVATRAFQAGAVGYVVKDARMGTMLGDAFDKALSSIDLENALKDLAESREELALVADSIPMYVARVGADERYRYVNRQYADLLGRPAAWFVGRPVSEAIGLEHYRNSKPRIDAVLSGETVSYESAVLTPRGERVLKRLLVPRLDAAGNVTDYFSFGEDVTGRRKAEEVRLRGHSMMTRFMELSPVGIIILDPAGQITFANKKAEDMLRLPMSALPRTVDEIPLERLLGSDGEPVPREQWAFEVALRTRAPVFDQEVMLKLMDGSEVWISLSVTPVIGKEGDVEAVIAALADVTERKLLEARLEWGRDMLGLVMDTSPVGIVVVDKEGLLVYANDFAAQIAGVRKEKIIGTRFTDGVWGLKAPNGEPLPPEKLPMEHIRKTGKAVIGACLGVQPLGGKWSVVSVNASPLTGPGGDYEGGVFALQDITELLAGEEVSQRWGAMIQSAEVAIAVSKAADRTYELVNQRFAQMHGYTPEELVGQPFSMVLAGGELDHALEMARIADESGERYAFESMHERKDGSVFPCLVELAPLKDETGKLVRHVVNVQDISLMKKAEEELKRVNSELEGYAHVVSHDLRAPLSAINLSNEILKDALESADLAGEKTDIADSVGKIDRNVARAFELIDELLTIAEAGREPQEVTSVEVSLVVREILDERSESIREKGVEVAVDAEFGTVIAHGVHVYQIFSNIIGNALKYNSSEQPTLEVRYLGAQQDRARMYLIRDNGPGIPDRDLERIFMPFFRRGDGEGVGMGLTTVWKLVGLYRGRIRAYNDNGACFEFTLKDFEPPD